jgi:hypothetical protein
MNHIETTVPETGAAPGAQEVTRQPERYAMPPVDIFETDQMLVVLADLPGVSKEGLSVQVEKGILTIEGKVERDTPVACGHTVTKGSKVYTLTFVVCEQAAAHLYLSVRACFQALQDEKAGEWKPSFAYRLWHATIGKLMQKKKSA